MSRPPSPLHGYTSGGLHVSPEDLQYVGTVRQTRSRPGELLQGLEHVHQTRRRNSSTDPNLLLGEDPVNSLAPTEPSTPSTPESGNSFLSTGDPRWSEDSLRFHGGELTDPGDSLDEPISNNFHRVIGVDSLRLDTPGHWLHNAQLEVVDEDQYNSATSGSSNSGTGSTIEYLMPTGDQTVHLPQPPLVTKMEQLVRDKYVMVSTANMLCEDEELDTLDLNSVTQGFVEDLIKQSEAGKRSMREAYAFLELNDPVSFTDQKKQELQKIKTTFVNFVKRGQIFLKEKEDAQAAAAISKNNNKQGEIFVKRSRVNNRKTKIVNNMQSLIDEFSKLGSISPETDQHATKLFDKYTDVKSQTTDILKDASELSKDAIDIDATEDAVIIDEIAQMLKDASLEAKEVLMDVKDKFGLVPSSNIKSSSSDAKKPIFSGETGKEEQLDFYTFQDEFWKYIGTRSASSAEQLRILTQDCLVGRPKISCKNFKSLDEVFTLLKKRYGNPKIMFDAKLTEIRKLGACPPALVKQREWFENVHEKVEYLVELSEKFNLTSLLEHSGLAAEIRAGLPKDLHKDLMDELTLQADEYDMVPLSVEFKQVRNFLDRTIQTSTIHLNLSQAEKTETKDEPKKVAVEVKTDKKPVKKTYQSTSSNQTADGQRQQQPRGAARGRGGRSGGVPRNTKTQPTTTPASGPKNKSPATPPLTFNGAEKPAAEKPCKNCSGQHTLMYYCPTFLAAPARERAKLAAVSHTCFRCLRLDSKCDLNNIDAWWDIHKNDCRTEFVCNVDKCGSLPHIRQRNILLCAWHTSVNKNRENDLVASLDSSKIPAGASMFYGIDMNIYNMNTPRIHNLDYEYFKDGFDIIPDISNPGIFMLQEISPTNEPDRRVVIFYDTGCGTAAISDAAVSFMETETVREGPSYLHVAGGSTVKLEGGDERFWLEMNEKKSKATITGLNIPTLTCPFPVWKLTDAFAELEQSYESEYPDGERLPSVPDQVGGQPVDIMLGIRYIIYFPKLIYNLPHGLGVYKSVFKGSGDHQGILGGPHKAWFEAIEASNFMGTSAYLSCEMRAYQAQTTCLRFIVDRCEAEELDKTEDEFFLEDNSEAESTINEANVICEYYHCSKHSRQDGWMINANWNLKNTIYNLRSEERLMNEIEVMGTEATYRCINCRNCDMCRKGDRLEQVSLQEELEQAMITDSVKYIPEEQRVEATLPFLEDPSIKLKPNKHIAFKILESQMKLFENHPEMRLDTLKSHEKLLSKGHVINIEDISEDEKFRMNFAPGEGYFIPWRTVHKTNSLSTPCRMVFDASSRTPNGGESLNAILPKGQNLLINLLHLLVYFRLGPFAFTFDVSMAYNQIKLAAEFYKYHKYLWIPDLNPDNPVVTMIVRTLIYGVKSAGNQTGIGFQRLSEHCKEFHPEYSAGAEVLENSVYVDDGLDSSCTEEERELKIEGVRFTLGLGGMNVKGFTRSGQVPPEELTTNGTEVGALGYIWNPLEDVLLLDIKELCFGKAKRGRRPQPVEGDILEALSNNFTKRILLSVISGVFDPMGLVTAVTAKFKLDMNNLVKLNLGWDEAAPADLLPTWVENIETIQDLAKLRFKRAVIPIDAAEDLVELIISVDASEKMAIATVHGRVLMKNGNYHVQLIAAKSKIVSGSTIPRGELKAAVAGCILGHVIKVNFGKHFKDILYVTDSTIILHWINQDERPMHVGVRNSVIEIRRFSLKTSWFHIDTELNIADLGTRGAAVQDINSSSEWQQGKPWMKIPRRIDMPIKSLEQVKLTVEEKRQVASELKGRDVVGYIMSSLTSKVGERYSFSKFIIDPCCLTWRKLNISLVLVRRFCFSRAGTKFGDLYNKKFNLTSLDQPVSEEEIQAAEYYFFKKGTLEVKHFSKHKDWKHCTVWKDGLLQYTGRILDGQEILSMEKCMLDLGPLTFVKPVLDRFSPVAYSIMIYCHEEVVSHRSSTNTLRASRFIAYILGGRDLAIEIREACVHCRRFKARMVKTEMGKIHENRLTIAPVFWNVQVDLMGPFLAHCEHNHRSTVKVWGLIFKDPGSGAVYAHVMQGYDAASFVLAYTRFACRFGHPHQLFIDEGSQLVKGCKNMEICWTDISKTLNGQYRVGLNFKTCPVGGHNFNGVVERSIQEIKKIFYTVYNGLKLDILAYETAFGWVSNELNNLPICLGSKTQNLDNLDLITPQRLISGLNNKRAPQGPMRIDAPSRLIKQMEKVYDSWWETWTMEKVINYIPRPTQWTKSTYQPQINDIVVFRKDENDNIMGTRVWRTGRIYEMDESRDGLPKAVVIQYKNASETVFRYTRRSIRKVAVVHQEHELELIQELNAACKEAEKQFYIWEQSADDLGAGGGVGDGIGDQLGENFIFQFSCQPWPKV